MLYCFRKEQIKRTYQHMSQVFRKFSIRQVLDLWQRRAKKAGWYCTFILSFLWNTDILVGSKCNWHFTWKCCQKQQHKTALLTLGMRHFQLLLGALLYPCRWSAFCLEPWSLWQVGGSDGMLHILMKMYYIPTNAYSYITMLVNHRQPLSIHQISESLMLSQCTPSFPSPRSWHPNSRPWKRRRDLRHPLSTWYYPPIMVFLHQLHSRLLSFRSQPDWYRRLSAKGQEWILTHSVSSTYYQTPFSTTSVIMQLRVPMRFCTSPKLISLGWDSRLERLLTSRRLSRCGHRQRKVSDHSFSCYIELFVLSVATLWLMSSLVRSVITIACLEIPTMYKVSDCIITCNNFHNFHQLEYHAIPFTSKVQSVTT